MLWGWGWGGGYEGEFWWLLSECGHFKVGWGWEDSGAGGVEVVGFQRKCWWLCKLGYAGIIRLSNFVSIDR